MSKTITGNDFLTAIQEAEAAAVSKVKKAHKKTASALQDYQKKEEIKMQEVLLEARKKAKGKLKDRQEVAKARYAALVADGEKEAATLVKNIEPKIEKQVPLAQAYFVNEILG